MFIRFTDLLFKEGEMMTDWNPFTQINITSGELLGLAMVIFSLIATMILLKKMFAGMKK